VEGIPEAVPTALQSGKEVYASKPQVPLLEILSPACAHHWNQTMLTGWCVWQKTWKRLPKSCRPPSICHVGLNHLYLVLGSSGTFIFRYFWTMTVEYYFPKCLIYVWVFSCGSTLQHIRCNTIAGIYHETLGTHQWLRHYVQHRLFSHYCIWTNHVYCSALSPKAHSASENPRLTHASISLQFHLDFPNVCQNEGVNENDDTTNLCINSQFITLH